MENCDFKVTEVSQILNWKACFYAHILVSQTRCSFFNVQLSPQSCCSYCQFVLLQLHENEEKKDAENDNVVYADLDKSALGGGIKRKPTRPGSN